MSTVEIDGIRSAWPDHPGYEIYPVPVKGTARVTVGGVVLAESTAAVRLIETDHVERLYFPEADVRIDLLAANDHQTVCPFKGRASYWSYDGDADQVENVFWTYRRPFPEVAPILGFLGVYHEKDGVQVEVETAWPDGRTSLNRFPAWGDQDDLVRVLDSVPVREGRFTAPGYHHRERDVVEGGQLLGEVIVAASRANPDQRVTFASMTFAKAASFALPLDLEVESIRRGRTFSTLGVRVSQSGKLIAPALVLMDTGAPDTIRGTEEMPKVPGPEDAEPYEMGVIGRDLRIVDGAYSPDPDRVGTPVINAWVRFRDDPADQGLRAALIAQATTHWTIAAAMRPHRGYGEAMAHVSLSTGPMAMSISFHDEARADEWLLYSTPAIWSGRGLAQGDGRVFTRDGVLVASYHLQAMIRAMIPATEGKDATNAM
jgi:acyl-CoA thioesterase II